MKYLGIYLDKHALWNFQLRKLNTKLSWSCDVLAKLRLYVNSTTIQSVYHKYLTHILGMDLRSGPNEKCNYEETRRTKG